MIKSHCLWLSPLPALLFMSACSSSEQTQSVTQDASVVEVSAPGLELVCASNFCGNIRDKNTGAVANCGECPTGSQCGDNNTANICGSKCMPLLNADVATYGLYDVSSCDYALGGPGWGSAYGTEQQYPSACDYVDQDNCVAINIQRPPNGECTICGTWWCCAEGPGSPALLPNAVANSDGGLP
jgi:hypothetical protein